MVLKLVFNVNIVYGNLGSANSQDYAQKPERNCTFMNLASGLVFHHDGMSLWYKEQYEQRLRKVQKVREYRLSRKRKENARQSRAKHIQKCDWSNINVGGNMYSMEALY
jgi:hypothetical protein